ncbi:MAG TPA: PEP-CTERM sorting domain-containing protein [Fimbriimonadaceae bacterium]|nr:PEP-CTERM sorting domain-containing protein [Fimbriimonadaceae bacterium]
MKLSLSLGLVAASAVMVNAQVIGDRATLNSILGTYVTDDFEAFNIGDGDATATGVPVLDNSTVVSGQGPGLVNLGVTYSDPGNAGVQWNGHNYYSINTRSILVNGGGSFQIGYSGSTIAMGLDLKSFAGYAYSGTMSVYSGATLVDTVAFSVDGAGGASTFVGYQHGAGITSVTLNSPTYSWSPIIDDHTFAAVPEPGTIAALGAGVLLLIRKRRK